MQRIIIVVKGINYSYGKSAT